MLDTINWKIIKALQENARISFAELGKVVHLSAPAVAERVKKLEESGVIQGYKPKLDLDKLGYPIVAQVQARVFLGKEPDFIYFVKSVSGVIECNNVTGEKAFLLKVVASNMKELDQLLEDFSKLCETNSMIVLSQIVSDTVLTPPPSN
ncbi:Lrp/AsnC family transcriptional regulator [Alteromonadaceae bacterium M269]|nr:Lrp/AsnC family transcriptional regulator [Alteromonadaceae bacterium M269]